MSDKVQRVLEDSVNNLNQLIFLKLFTEDEVKKIIIKRRKFEYDILTVDRDKSLISYQFYIDFELNLIKLIQLRMKKLNKSNKRSKNFTNGSINHDDNNDDLKNSKMDGVSLNIKSIKDIKGSWDVKKILLKFYSFIYFIFDRCLNRFVNNIKIYELYLNFCKNVKNYKLFEKVLLNGLSKNPTNENLWLILASYVLKSKGLVSSKNIVNKSLRMSNSVDLILYLFNLEVKILIKYLESRTESVLNDDINGSSGIRVSSTTSVSERSNLCNEDDEYERNVNSVMKNCYLIFEYYFNLDEGSNYPHSNSTEYISVPDKVNEKSKALTKSRRADIVKFYFNVLDTVNSLIDRFGYDKVLIDRLNSLMNSINLKVRDIPIIRLHNYQVQMIDLIRLSLVDCDCFEGDSIPNDILKSLKSALVDKFTEMFGVEDVEFRTLLFIFLYNILTFNHPDSCPLVLESVFEFSIDDESKLKNLLLSFLKDDKNSKGLSLNKTPKEFLEKCLLWDPFGDLSHCLGDNENHTQRDKVFIFNKFIKLIAKDLINILTS